MYQVYTYILHTSTYIHDQYCVYCQYTQYTLCMGTALTGALHVMEDDWSQIEGHLLIGRGPAHEHLIHITFNRNVICRDSPAGQAESFKGYAMQRASLPR